MNMFHHIGRKWMNDDERFPFGTSIKKGRKD